MAKIGLKFPVAAKLDETTGGYKDGIVIGKSIKADISPSNYDASQYADDEKCEVENGFQSCSETLELNDLTQEVASYLLGHKVDEETGEMIANADDVAPYVGHGYYCRVKRNNKLMFRALWFPKVKFAEPSDNAETKGESINFQSSSITSEIIADSKGDWKREKTFETEAEAISWLKEKASIQTSAS